MSPLLLLPPFVPSPSSIRSWLQGGRFELGDRVVSILKQGSPPFGLHGTVIGGWRLARLAHTCMHAHQSATNQPHTHTHTHTHILCDAGTFLKTLSSHSCWVRPGCCTFCFHQEKGAFPAFLLCCVLYIYFFCDCSTNLSACTVAISKGLRNWRSTEKQAGMWGLASGMGESTPTWH